MKFYFKNEITAMEIYRKVCRKHTSTIVQVSKKLKYLKI